MSSVDVVIPCYRYGAMLPLAVGSVLAQPGVDVRVLVIDDASGDGSAEVAYALSAADARVEVRIHERNHGHISTFNEGLLDWARAHYCVLMSADDALTPGALSRAAQLLDAHPEVGFVYGHPLLWDGSEPLPTARTTPAGWKVYSGNSWLRRRFTAANNCIWSPEVVVRTSLQHRIGGYHPDLLHTSDLEMWLRFALHADVGFLQGVDQAYYRVHGANMSNSYKAESVRELRMRLAAFSVLLTHADGRLHDTTTLERQVRRRLARHALADANLAHSRGEQAYADQLVQFAADTAGDLDLLPEWHLYRIRRSLGPRHAAALGFGAISVPAQRLRRRIRDHRREWLGL